MRKYDKEFKANVVFEICELGMSTSKTAIRYGVPVKTVEKWLTAYRKDKDCFTVESECSDVTQLLKTITRLKRENEILKKTIKLFSKQE